MSLSAEARRELDSHTQGPAVQAVERATLGCLLLDSRLIHVAQLAKLRGEHFGREAHRIIYGAMMKRYVERKRFDLPLIVSDLERDGLLERAGGAAYVSWCLDNIDVEMVEDYIAVVQECALERRLAAQKAAR